MASNTMYLLEITVPGMYTAQEFDQLFQAEAEIKFKVRGENRMVAVIHGDNVDAALACMKDPPPGMSVKCTPTTSYEGFAKNHLGLTDDEVTVKGPTPPFDATKEAFWVRFNIEYAGHTLDDFKQVWHDEAVAAQGLVHSGLVPAKLYKSVFNREVHLFVQQTAEQVDGLPYRLPLMKGLGDQVHNAVRGVTLIV